MKTVSVIRERGQLTIPESIRRVATWASASSPVSISVDKPDEIVIRPHGSQKKVDWDALWKRIERVRAFKGNGIGNLSAFIAKDRETRR